MHAQPLALSISLQQYSYISWSTSFSIHDPSVRSI
jgi:hypothetical protein